MRVLFAEDEKSLNRIITKQGGRLQRGQLL